MPHTSLWILPIKNPSFKPSYTISQSETREISDFNIYNNGAGIKADWDYKMSMVEKDIWNAFRQPFMKKVRVLIEKSTNTLPHDNSKTIHGVFVILIKPTIQRL
ncbi:MAG: hypothetical protein FWD97_02080 [Defluviitaleaceae bacterium]|nr:hypothetical protein [Defluviitaleaceae bacterium]